MADKPAIPDKTSATLAKFLSKIQVSKHPSPFPHRTMLFMSLKQRSTNPPTLNIDLGGQGGIFLGLWRVFDNFGKMWQVSLMVLSGIVWDYAKIWKFTKLPNSEIIDFFRRGMSSIHSGLIKYVYSYIYHGTRCQ